MSPRSICSLPKIGACVVLGLAGLSLSPVHGDLHTMAQEAHHDLQQALNPGGDPPSNDERTVLLNSAMDTIKDFPPLRRERVRAMVLSYLKSALDELKNGDPNHQVSEDIRDADAIIRDIESAS